ncbi:LuxR family transcriptional regulator [Kitasatospora xanthocidica]|uniref:LuxR family transcriptional regulator n=1 Tax=Kitasatospora xanthocidica TaxID=83382 RepID=A0A372ZYX0_9ACTN|nr:LuxR C-terminal-related transcriptional regulator [Kitasatospora xanthocidica]RGD60527.1 LuxR family transcriptional regulator [Kitasatospora xanthocidica]
MPDADLPDAAARELYREILRDGGRLHVADIRPEDEPTVRQLADLGLLLLHATDGFYTSINPRAVGERLGTELREESSRLLAKAALIPDLLEDLTQAYDAAPRRTEPAGGVRRVAGMVEIRHLVARLIKDYPHECLTAQPGRFQPPAQRGDGLAHTLRYIERGGSVRTIYQPQARLDGDQVEFAAESTRIGSRIRVLDAAFSRTLIFDRTVAVIPATPDNKVAAVVEDPAVVAYVVDVFEQRWQQADVVDWAALAAGSVAPAAHEQVGRLLARGLTQRAIASRLGLSERTVAGHIARLRELYDAETLFQLGWQMRGARAGEPGG